MCDPGHGARQGHAVRRIIFKSEVCLASRKNAQRLPRFKPIPHRLLLHRSASKLGLVPLQSRHSFCLQVVTEPQSLSSLLLHPQLVSHRSTLSTTHLFFHLVGTPAPHRRYSCTIECITWCSGALPVSTLAVQCGMPRPYMASAMVGFRPNATTGSGNQGHARGWIRVGSNDKVPCKKQQEGTTHMRLLCPPQHQHQTIPVIGIDEKLWKLPVLLLLLVRPKSNVTGGCSHV
jgi:hypothetical protein